MRGPILTGREADVLECAIDGASIEEIAVRAHLSAGTTRNYLSAAMGKLGASNRYEAALKVRRFGWIRTTRSSYGRIPDRTGENVGIAVVTGRVHVR